MFVGDSGGSTGGGSRWCWPVILKAIRRELFPSAHPQSVRPVRLNGHVVDETATRGVFAFTLLSVPLFLLGGIALLVDAIRSTSRSPPSGR